LSGVIGRNANFIQVRLCRAKLSINYHANARATDFSGANFQGADLSFADLSGAILRNANFSDADLTGTILHNTDLQGAIMPDTFID
ncbi:MAG: pentapeptide repeat-containing protein, partial [Leptolyngbyaceae bacterium]|nr:pentapeptide repeat-containing protein [Leptolyngbyaceae bacterium]